MTAAESVDITRELARGKFTDEMLSEMRARIGLELRTYACINNEDASRLAILRFCEGIGDDNPLWTDPDYAGGIWCADAAHACWPAPSRARADQRRTSRQAGTA